MSSKKNRYHMSDVEPDSSDNEMNKSNDIGLLVNKRGLSDSDDEHIDKAYKCEIPHAPGVNNSPDSWADLAAAPADSADFTCQQVTTCRPIPEYMDEHNTDRPNTADLNKPTAHTDRPTAGSSVRPSSDFNYGDRPLHVYLEGTRSDFAQYTKRHLRTVQNEINEYLRPDGAIAATQWFFQGRFIRITCNNMQQVKKLLAITKIGDIGIKCSLPRAIVNNRPNTTAAKKSYIVFGISGDIPPEEVLNDNQCTGKNCKKKMELTP